MSEPPRAQSTSSPEDDRPLLSVVGVYSEHIGYPNVRFRLADLTRSARYRVSRVHRTGFGRLTLGGTARRSRLRQSLTFVGAHVSLWARLRFSESLTLCYVPYPAVFVCALTRLLPAARRPRHLIVDAFIGLHDTVVNDRGLLGARHPLARLLWRLERLAFRHADAVVVDTELNRAFMAEHYRLPPDRFVAIPLSTDERRFPSRASPDHEPFTVLFVGTLIPLHGLPLMLGAMEALRGRRDIRFEIIGDGQMGPEVERVARTLPDTIHWHRDWLDGEALARRIAGADLCLGIFGASDKAQRVCPLKLYAYLFHARAVITARTRWTEQVRERDGELPFETLDLSEGAAGLAARISTLLDDPEGRADLQARAAAFYRDRLSNARGLQALEALFERVSGRSAPGSTGFSSDERVGVRG